MRKVLFKLHFFGAVVGALFVVILGLTGSVMAFEEEIDGLTHPHLLRVVPAGPPLPLTALAARAMAAVPGGRVNGYGLGGSPDRSIAVSLTGASVYVNPYTGDVLGTRGGPTLLSQIHQLHLRLLAGSAGRTIVAWSGVLMLFLVVSGLYLWWPVKRITIDRRAAGRRIWFDVHNAVGVFAFVFLLLLSLTGVVIGFESVTGPLLYRITGSQPYPFNLPVTARPGAPMLSPDDALAIARAAMPGATAIGLSVATPRTPYRVALRYPEDRTPGGRSRVFVDPYDGRVLQAESSRTTAAGTRLVTLNRAIHTGDLFGLPSKILMSLASLAAVLQVVTGLVMWRKRRTAVARVRARDSRAG
jgi:uncharacterized iron-regulated membrane protein